MNPLDGPRFKIMRAKKHFDAIDRSMRRYLDGRPYSMAVYPNADGTRKILRASIKAPPETRLSLLMGDFAHNLRSALDHIAWEFALIAAPRPPRGVQFPIFRSEPTDRRGWNRQTQCLGIAYDFVESLQPYYRGLDAFSHPLWVLHAVNTIDKHQTIAILTHELRVRLRDITPDTAEFLHGRFNDGDEVMNVPFDTDVEQHLKPNIQGRVHFDVGEDLPRGIGVSNLYEAHEFVTQEVLPPLTRLYAQAVYGSTNILI